MCNSLIQANESFLGNADSESTILSVNPAHVDTALVAQSRRIHDIQHPLVGLERCMEPHGVVEGSHELNAGVRELQSVRPDHGIAQHPVACERGDAVVEVVGVEVRSAGN